MNFLQKIAVKWYQIFDTGLLFEVVRNSNRVTRYIIYIAFPLSLYFVFFMIGNVIDLEHSQFLLEYPIFTLFLMFFGKIALWIALFFASLIFTYESALKLNLEKIKREKLYQKNYIKANKLQWWRLRNMSLIKRIFVYVFVYFILLQVTQLLTTDAIIQAQNIDMNAIIQEYKILLAQISFIYIFIIMVLDYFVSKKRGAK